GGLLDFDLFAQVGGAAARAAADQRVNHLQAEGRTARVSGGQEIVGRLADRRRTERIDGGLRSAGTDTIPEPLLAELILAINRPTVHASLGGVVDGDRAVGVLKRRNLGRRRGVEHHCRKRQRNNRKIREYSPQSREEMQTLHILLCRSV